MQLVKDIIFKYHTLSFPFKGLELEEMCVCVCVWESECVSACVCVCVCVCVRWGEGDKIRARIQIRRIVLLTGGKEFSAMIFNRLSSLWGAYKTPTRINTSP